MDNLSKLPQRLKDLLEEAEISARKLAVEIDIEHSAVSKYLRGGRLPSADTIVKICDYFHCTADYLLGKSDVLDERTFKQRPPFNEQLSFLLKYFKITKYRLKKMTGLAELTINNWHKGKCEPAAESLILLAEKLKCSIDFVLGREV